MPEPSAMGPDSDATPRATRRVALGVSYRGTAYKGWQSQAGGGTVQDALQAALSRFADQPVSVVCAGRTDAGVHGINQVVHLDTPLRRDPFSWVRGTNAFLPRDIAVQWALEVPDSFHARQSAHGRRYAFILLESAVRPALEAGHAGWVFRGLDHGAMEAGARHLIGQHDFSSFRSSQCQSPTPVKTLREIHIRRCREPARPLAPGAADALNPDVAPLDEQGPGTHNGYWRVDFEGTAFLHHMIRNIMGCLIAVGTGQYPPHWIETVRNARNRKVAAPTFPADGLYFLGPHYDPALGIPNVTPALAWLPH